MKNNIMLTVASPDVAAVGMIIIHSPRRAVNKSGGFFVLRTIFILAITGSFAVILSARGLSTTLRATRANLPAAAEVGP